MVKVEVDVLVLQLNFDLEVTDKDITTACSFANKKFENPLLPLVAGYVPNLSCPTKAIRTYGEDSPFVLDGGFLMTEFMYGIVYGPLSKAMWQHDKYRKCHQGYELGCAAKIPYPEESEGLGALVLLFGGPDNLLGVDVQPGDSSKKWQEYCKFAAVWNGDIKYERYDDIGLSPEVKECGCFFVGNAGKNVGACPGMELYAHFEGGEG